MIRRILLLSLFLPIFLCACSNDQGELRGAVTFGEAPLANAQIEVYLKQGEERSAQPFAVTTSDEQGNYRLTLPAGRYYLISKKKTTLDGAPRMLMAEYPGNPVEVTSSAVDIPSFGLQEMGGGHQLDGTAGTGLQGSISGATPGSATFVYVYTDNEGGLIGPGYGKAVRVDPAGEYRINLPPGSYWLVARHRNSGARSGAIEPGDQNGPYPGNPVTVVAGSYLSLEPILLKEVDPERRRKREEAGTFASTGTGVSGKAIDPDGQPVSGVYLFAYRDSRMVGKPDFISPATGEDGSFTLQVESAGTYHIGARSAYGGPLEPGEWVGTYDAVPDHHIDISEGVIHPLGTISVHEVW